MADDPLTAERAAVAAAERALVLAALRLARGNRTRAAQLLDATPRSVGNWIRQHDLTAELDALAEREGWDAGVSPAERAARGYRAKRAR